MELIKQNGRILASLDNTKDVKIKIILIVHVLATLHKNQRVKMMINDNPCPKCKIGEIVVYSKPDGNYYCCNNCDFEVGH